MTNKDNTLEWIQALRGVAVLLVVLTHARYYFLDTPTWPVAEMLMRPGAMGVDLFFIISGFIMAYTTSRSDGSPGYVRDFAIKRFARVWPLYVVITVVSIVANSGFAFFHDANNRLIFFRSLAFIPAVPEKPLYFGTALPLGWTLDFEMYFYAIFAVSMLFRRFRWLVLAAWMVTTIYLVPVCLGDFSMDVLQNHNYAFSYFNLMANPIILEFLAGAVIGLLYKNQSVRIHSVLVCVNLVGLSVGFAIWYAYGRIADFHGPSKWGWPLALMVCAMAIASKTIVLKPPRLMIWLGTISYSLYLTHTTSQLLVTKWAMAHSYDTQSWSHIFLTTVVALSVASFCYRYLEQGMSGWIRDHMLRWASRIGRAATPGDTPVAMARSDSTIT